MRVKGRARGSCHVAAVGLFRSNPPLLQLRQLGWGAPRWLHRCPPPCGVPTCKRCARLLRWQAFHCCTALQFSLSPLSSCMFLLAAVGRSTPLPVSTRSAAAFPPFAFCSSLHSDVRTRQLKHVDTIKGEGVERGEGKRAGRQQRARGSQRRRASMRRQARAKLPSLLPPQPLPPTRGARHLTLGRQLLSLHCRGATGGRLLRNCTAGARVSSTRHGYCP